MFSDNKPKFALSLRVNEISNIPHISGSCYVEAVVRDGKDNGLKSAFLNFKPAKSGEELSLKKASLGTVHVRTSKRKIHSFKCQFNYSIKCNLKFPHKKKDNIVGDKFLYLRVFYISDKEKGSASELGRLELNLAEYLNFDSAVSAKYLLQQSKINSIVSLTTELKELPSDFDFHTQLQIEDVHEKHKDELPSGALKTPQLSKTGDDKRKVDFSADTANRTFEQLIVDPVVSGLYTKILESAWDPELHVLLKLLPEKLVDDVFKLRKAVEEEYKIFKDLADTSDEKFEELNGLINESSYRSNLRSWTVGWVEKA